MLEKLSNIYMEEGLKNLQHNRLTTAEVNFQKAVSVYEGNWKAMNLLGLCLYTLGDFQEAEGFWKRSININTQDENKAYEYIGSLREPQFISLCDLYNKALKHATEGDFKRAEKFLNEEPFTTCIIIPFINLKGLCMLFLYKKEEAISLWKQSLLIDKENQDAINYIINCNDYKPQKMHFSNFIKKILGTS